MVKVDDYWLYIDDNGDKYRLLDTDEDGLPDSIWILPDTEGGENTDTDTETEPDTDPKDDLPKRCDRCGLITCNGNCVTPGGGGNSGGENKTPEISYKDGYICIDFQDDVLDKDDFSPYKDSEPTGCFDRCKEMLAEAGCEVDGGRKPICITNNENGTPIGISTDFQNGINEINKTLDNGKPIILNVDHTEGKCTSTDGAGDHFVIVVGKAVIDGNTYYHFYDPATGDVNTGTKNTNVLYVKEDGYLSGTFIKRNGRDVKDYTVTSVRPNKNI